MGQVYLRVNVIWGSRSYEGQSPKKKKKAISITFIEHKGRVIVIVKSYRYRPNCIYAIASD